MQTVQILLEFLQAVLCLPLFAAEVWTRYKLKYTELIYAHAFLGLLPATIYCLNYYIRQDLVDLAVIFNGISLCVAGVTYKNYFAVAAALTFMVGFYGIRKNDDLSTTTAVTLYNFCMVAFNIMALECIKSIKVK